MESFRAALRRLVPHLRDDVNVMNHLRIQIEKIREISENAELNQLLAEMLDELRSTRVAGNSIFVADDRPS